VKGAHGKSFSGPFAQMPRQQGENPDCRLCDVLVRVDEGNTLYWQRSIRYKGSAFNLPLREEYTPGTTKKNLSRAQVLEKE
jgi:hypothetical protein